eukprot:CAMPEP_0178424856 /NCGR_PEP_ID=MMETSP0689_2-20121128/28426_1 /TAXON_ID=160604 /ORGANISM="Amphidinium massartii, Strain CS-259" /LENGTH=618 /DNA_ID=CAMNT_0020046507 /DNA_START=163 /DNA_END=2019 /DNA_ORIENTATION=-
MVSSALAMAGHARAHVSKQSHQHGHSWLTTTGPNVKKLEVPAQAPNTGSDSLPLMSFRGSNAADDNISGCNSMGCSHLQVVFPEAPAQSRDMAYAASFRRAAHRARTVSKSPACMKHVAHHPTAEASVTHRDVKPQQEVSGIEGHHAPVTVAPEQRPVSAPSSAPVRAHRHKTRADTSSSEQSTAASSYSSQKEMDDAAAESEVIIADGEEQHIATEPLLESEGDSPLKPVQPFLPSPPQSRPPSASRGRRGVVQRPASRDGTQSDPLSTSTESAGPARPRTPSSSPRPASAGKPSQRSSSKSSTGAGSPGSKAVRPRPAHLGESADGTASHFDLRGFEGRWRSLLHDSGSDECMKCQNVIKVVSRCGLLDEKLAPRMLVNFLESIAFAGAESTAMSMPVRGETNGQISYMQFIATLQWIADIKGVTYAEVASKFMVSMAGEEFDDAELRKIWVLHARSTGRMTPLGFLKMAHSASGLHIKDRVTLADVYHLFTMVGQRSTIRFSDFRPMLSLLAQRLGIEEQDLVAAVTTQVSDKELELLSAREAATLEGNPSPRARSLPPSPTSEQSALPVAAAPQASPSGSKRRSSVARLVRGLTTASWDYMSDGYEECDDSDLM